VYVPDSFRIDDPKQVLSIVRQHSFAVLVAEGANGLEANHLPLIVESEDPIVIAGHMSRANTQWRAFDGSREAIAVFSGPHTFISPIWYESRPNVPTWNYVAVHLHGKPVLIEGAEETLEHLHKVLSAFDPGLAEAQPESVAPDYLRKMLGGLVAFRMEVTRVEAKAKLNQNKLEPDRLAVKERLSKSDDPVLLEMSRMMRG
jgi:transcriptional regulator